jgi:hypothetical protein
MITKIDRGYAILYRFLKDKRLLYNYLENLSKKPHDVKSVLRNTVKKYITDNYWRPYNIDFFNDLFNWAPSSFYWNRSIEGINFWRPYYAEWKQYYNKEKIKYML